MEVWDYIGGLLLAFSCGGALCSVAQLLIDKTKLTPARILVIYAVTGVLLGALGLYDPLIRIFGCGATVPLTGFGAVVAKGVRRAIAERGAMGILTGALSAAAAGTGAALCLGYLAALIFSGKPKRSRRSGGERQDSSPGNP